MSKKKGMIVSGYFNPIHKGHIEYFNNAKALADVLFVIVNNDYLFSLKSHCSKNVAFIALNDGSIIHSIQVVADREKISDDILAQINTGTSLSIIGTVT